MDSNSTKAAWFRPVRRSYLPVSWQGRVIYLVYVAYLLILVIDWFHLGHHVWILITNVIPLSVAAAVLTQYVASKNS